MSYLFNYQKKILTISAKTLSFLPLLFLLTNILSSQSQKLEVFKYLEEDGLSNGFITTMLQDSKGFLWVGTAGGLNRFDGYSFKTFTEAPEDTASLSHPVVWSLCEDQDGYLWVGTDDRLNCLNPRTGINKQYEHQVSDSNSLSFNLIQSVSADNEGHIWIGTSNGLNRFSKKNGIFKRYYFDVDNPRIFRATFIDRQGNLWVGSLDTLFRYNRSVDRFYPIPLPSGNPTNNEIRHIYEDKAGSLWIGTQQNGVFKYDKENKVFSKHLSNQLDNGQRLSHNKVSSALEDHKGRVWLGTYGGGLNIIKHQRDSVLIIENSSIGPKSFNTKVVRSIVQDDHDNIWLGSLYDGLYKIAANSDQFKNFPHRDGQVGKNIISMCEDNAGNVWMASNGGGLFKLTHPDLNWTINEIFPQGPEIFSKNLKAITQDQEGNLWMGGVDDGLVTYDPVNNRITSNLSELDVDGICTEWIQALFLESPEHLWIGSQDGLCRLNILTKEIESYPLPIYGPNDKMYGDNRNVLAINSDNSGDLWICTAGGINLYDRKERVFTFIPFAHQVVELFEDSKGNVWVSTFQGLASLDRAKMSLQFVRNELLPRVPLHGFLEDQESNIWFGSGKGIHRFSPVSREVISFNKSDGLVGNHFLSSLKTKEGRFYFGGMDGLVTFHPDSLTESLSIPPPVLTDFKLFNKSVPIQGTRGDTLDWKSPLSSFISYQDELTLQHWQNYFSIEFSTLDFTAPNNIKYQYKLEGYDQEWVNTDASRRFVTYTNMNPGKYTFKLRAANKLGQWGQGEDMLFLTIRKPWWATWWAIFFYILLGALILYAIYRAQLNRRILEVEALRLQELDSFKSNLYTSVTHEFRTPLTIIASAVTKLREQVAPSLFRDLSIISKSVRRSLTLVQQLLDFSKLQNNTLPIKWVSGDFIEYLRYIIGSFHSYAESKEIDLLYELPEQNLQMDFDEDKILTIISNLLSNAIKFTPKGGQVKLSLKVLQEQHESLIKIIVTDSGPGIPSEEQEKIFDIFYQTANHQEVGTGVGLALVKELVLLLNGKIKLESLVNKGSKFTLTFPFQNKAQTYASFGQESVSEHAAGFIPAIPTDTMEFVPDSQLPIALIAEDNPDLAYYLAFQLKDNFQVVVCGDGTEAFEFAVADIPDIIISDVLMPNMDGFELVKALRFDQRTSHIPIILLTAKSDTSSKLIGLSRGADAYLVKPFQREELLIRMKVLIKTRLLLQERYQKAGSIPPEKDKLLALEDEFMQELIQILEANYADQNFGVQSLIAVMPMSRAQIYRKVHALTNTSVALYIRNFRLEKARPLLHLSNISVKEVALSVGFKDPDYFSRVFKGYFGFPPSEVPK